MYVTILHMMVKQYIILQLILVCSSQWLFTVNTLHLIINTNEHNAYTVG